MAEQDMKQAEASYDGFIKLIKWGAILSAITTAIVILLIY